MVLLTCGTWRNLTKGQGKETTSKFTLDLSLQQGSGGSWVKREREDQEGLWRWIPGCGGRTTGTAPEGRKKML